MLRPNARMRADVEAAVQDRHRGRGWGQRRWRMCKVGLGEHPESVGERQNLVVEPCAKPVLVGEEVWRAAVRTRGQGAASAAPGEGLGRRCSRREQCADGKPAEQDSG